jgi:uncharacterized protein YlxP (DUF503 family)
MVTTLDEAMHEMRTAGAARDRAGIDRTLSDVNDFLQSLPDEERDTAVKTWWKFLNAIRDDDEVEED